MRKANNPTAMKKFLVLYRAPVSAQEKMANATPEQAKAGMDAWMRWMEKSGDLVVDLGQPLGSTKHMTGKALGDGDHTIAGFSIVQGNSMDAVTRQLHDHPHFLMPGGCSIEVHEFLPMPGM